MAIITDEEITEMSISQIESLRLNPENQFNLTNLSLHHAYETGDREKMKYLKDTFQLKLPGDGHYLIDVAVEEGHEEMAKFLVTEFQASPSLYAKQMARVNGYHQLASWMDCFSQQRNNIGLHNVHRCYDRRTKKMKWHDVIPVEHRYI